MFQSKINVMLYDAANSANNVYPGPLTILRSAQSEREVLPRSPERCKLILHPSLRLNTMAIPEWEVSNTEQTRNCQRRLFLSLDGDVSSLYWCHQLHFTLLTYKWDHSIDNLFTRRIIQLEFICSSNFKLIRYSGNLFMSNEFPPSQGQQ